MHVNAGLGALKRTRTPCFASRTHRPLLYGSDTSAHPLINTRKG